VSVNSCLPLLDPLPFLEFFFLLAFYPKQQQSQNNYLKAEERDDRMAGI
jgi:hypothetical protein